tara:strand:+ start:512 stop:1498 length:987 start_codon:yes stop_codon:yes gene_type:complete
VKRLYETIDAWSDLFLEPGDVLVQRSNTLDLVGTTAVFNGPAREYVYPDLMMRMRFRDDTTAHWFWRYANSASGRRFFIRVAAGSSGSMPKISGDRLRGMRLPLPPIPEQEAIAEALSDADALIESLEQLIAKKRHIKQGAMQELLTGKKRLPGFSGEWEVKQIGELLSIKHGKSHRSVEDSNGKYPILATSGQIGTANEYLYDKPSVLIGRKGTIDRPQYMEQPFWTIDTLFFSIIYDPNDPKYLFYQFCLIDWKQFNEASGVPSLNARTIEQIELKAPTLPEQQAIATILSDMDAEITGLESKLDKARQVKQGMMHNLLTGRIRLI